MRESPRVRRLRNDHKNVEQLASESTILEFSTPGPLYGGPPEVYVVRFHGRGVWRPDGSTETHVRDRHEVHVQLGASYPRTMPELSWKTPIFHPNISASGVVCLGGYGTHWVPSLGLHELCEMLWDMIRYHNYDVESPYNREAAMWARNQTGLTLPLDERPIRDKVAGGREGRPPITTAPQDFIIFESEVVEAEVIEDDKIEDDKIEEIEDDVDAVDAAHRDHWEDSTAGNSTVESSSSPLDAPLDRMPSGSETDPGGEPADGSSGAIRSAEPAPFSGSVGSSAGEDQDIVFLD